MNTSEKVAYLIYGNETTSGSAPVIFESKQIGFLEIEFYYYKDVSKVLREIVVLSSSITILLILIGGFSYYRGILLIKFSKQVKESLKKESGIDSLEGKSKYQEFNAISSSIKLLLSNEEDKASSKMSNASKEISDQNEEIQRLKEEKSKLSKNLKSHRQLVASIGHDLRSPLNVIQTTASLLMRGDLTDNQLERVRRIIRSTEETSSLADNIMNTALFDEDGDKEEIIDAIDFVDNLVIDARNQSTAQGLNIYFFPDSNLKNSLISNPTRLRRVIGNLLNNAIKFSKNDGSIKVIVETKIENKQNYLKVSISDEGKGISSENINHIFKDNYQDEDETQNARGIGLGLYICKEFISRMGGNIGAHSLEGVGSTFWFEVPVTIKSETSGEQDKVINAAKIHDISMAMVSPDLELASAISQTSIILGQPMSAFSSPDEIDGHYDVVCSYGLLASNDDEIRRFKEKCRLLVSIERDNDAERQQNPLIDLAIKRNTGTYRKLHQVYQLIQRSKMPKIGAQKTTTGDTSAIQNPFASTFGIESVGQIDGYRVLLVDDHDDSRVTIKDILEIEGATVHEARSLSEASEILRNRKLDVLITDFFLDDSTGKDIVDAANKSDMNRDVSKICCTGDTSLSRDKSLLTLFDAILTKPVDEKRLMTIVSSLSKKKTQLNLVSKS